MSVLNSSTPLKSGIQTLKSITGTEDLFCSSPGGGGNRVGIQSYLQSNQNTNTQVDYSLNAPTIRQKCAELTYILDNCPQKDLAAAFHKIVDKVFDVRNGGRGFNVGYVLRSREPEDFRALLSFLGSTGPMLRTGAKLLSDPYLRFEFPISLLSTFTQQQIESMVASQFIASKLSPHDASNLMLNSFEYYIFTFATYLVKPYTMDNKIQSGDSLYTVLVEEYLTYFLPCDGSTPPLLPSSVNVTASSPPSPSPMEMSPSSSTRTTPGRKSLLRHGNAILSSPSKPTSPVYSSPDQHQTSSQQVYRSESMIYTFFELWLSPFCQTAKNKTDSPLSHSLDIMIPVSDTLRIIRMLIKHLHFFVNSGGPLDISPLCQLKRTILPNVKCRVYSLFKFIFLHWPHDMSFRLVLETWLSYIQPWRYTDVALSHRINDEVTAVEVESKWQQFVAENILFYTHTLRLLLPRFFRMDLTASRNALMLFRIAKIFSQNGLKELIRNAESGLERGSGFGSLDRSYMDNMPSLLNLSEVSDVAISAARQCTLELEGAGFKYDPMFGNLFRQTVADILTMAARALEVAEDTVKASKAETTMNQSSFDWMVESILGGTKREEQNPEIEDFKKTINYLNQSIKSLTALFELSVPDSVGRRPGRYVDPSLGYVTSSPETECDQGTPCRVLTPHGRWQVLQGVAKPDCRYEGDPDEVAISENEIVWLVRLLHQVSTRLNTKYEDALQHVYQKNSVTGEVARMLLAEPCTFYKVKKRVDGGPPTRVYHVHKPRISLRVLGSWKFVIYLIFCLLAVSLLKGCGLLNSVILLIFISGVFIFLLATVRHVLKQTKPKQVDQLNISDLNVSKNDQSFD